MSQKDFIDVVQERGLMHQCTDPEGLRARLKSGPVVGYIGYDATAPSLHAGSMVTIMMLHWFQKTGNKPIVLMGGGTTKVGDPSGKDEARKLLTPETIGQNIAGIKKNFEGFVRFGDGPTDAAMVNNAEWLDGINYIDFLRDIGRHFTINRMLTFDSVKLRLDREQPLTFLEFNYMILQAYDYAELYKRYGCALQMGGSDQWGNIVNGIELGRRLHDAELFGLTCPLLTTASGAKMGKTAAGAVWLNPDMLSPYDYWQYWRNCEDADVGRFLRLFTTLDMAEIARLEALQGQEINEAKKILATEATALCHGDQAARAAAETARQTFEQGRLGADLPTVTMPRDALERGIPLYELLAQVGAVPSKSEARRLIKNGGAYVNDRAMDDEARPVTLDDCNADGVIKLSAGKKKHFLVKAG